jgi:predicted component of type VI protein secretion system
MRATMLILVACLATSAILAGCAGSPQQSTNQTDGGSQCTTTVMVTNTSTNDTNGNETTNGSPNCT